MLVIFTAISTSATMWRVAICVTQTVFAAQILQRYYESRYPASSKLNAYYLCLPCGDTGITKVMALTMPATGHWDMLVEFHYLAHLLRAVKACGSRLYQFHTRL